MDAREIAEIAIMKPVHSAYAREKSVQEVEEMIEQYVSSLSPQGEYIREEDPRELAKWMHDEYEEIAKYFGWKTQESTQTSFENLPISNRKTMIALAERLMAKLSPLNNRKE